MKQIAALFVRRGGVYWDLEGVDPWDEARDARKYNGPHPVVAHPPCSRWCRLAGLVEKRWGHKRGEDGGMFASALAAVRTWGGVLEHPAWSDAFVAHGIGDPPSLDWTHIADGASLALVSRCGNHTKKFDKRPRLASKIASSTPTAFRDLLIQIARQASHD